MHDGPNDTISAPTGRAEQLQKIADKSVVWVNLFNGVYLLVATIISICSVVIYVLFSDQKKANINRQIPNISAKPSGEIVPSSNSNITMAASQMSKKPPCAEDKKSGVEACLQPCEIDVKWLTSTVIISNFGHRKSVHFEKLGYRYDPPAVAHIGTNVPLDAFLINVGGIGAKYVDLISGGKVRVSYIFSAEKIIENKLDILEFYLWYATEGEIGEYNPMTFDISDGDIRQVSAPSTSHQN